MMWQDLVFLGGSLLSVAFLYPTLRDRASRVPRATSVPSMLIGGAYASTFFTLDMTFSALGAVAACAMWSLIALLRAPGSASIRSVRRTVGRVVDDCRRGVSRHGSPFGQSNARRVENDAPSNADR